MKTIVHFLPAKKPVPASFLQAILADGARATVVITRSK